MNSFSVEIKGLKELNNALNRLPEAVQGKALKTAVSGAASLVKKTAQKNLDAHNKTGTLKKQVRASLNKRQSSEWRAAYWVGVRKLKNAEVIEHRMKTRKTVRSKAESAKITGGDKSYWRFLEFGSSKQPKQPFLVPAFESQKIAAVDVIKTKLKTAIDKAVQKLRFRP